YSKKTGLNGELRLRSSSDADAIASSRTGSGGTIVGSATGSGGAGGREPVVELAPGGGGGSGRATGAGFLPHAATLITRSSSSAAPLVRVIVVSTILTNSVAGCCRCASAGGCPCRRARS